MRKDQKGFTLVELMVSVGIISIGIIGVAYIITQAQITNRRVKDKDTAYAMLNKKMEMIRETPYTYVLAGDTVFPVPELQQGQGLINVIFIDTPSDNFKKVTIRVQWMRWGSDAMQGETIVSYRTFKGLGLRSE